MGSNIIYAFTNPDMDTILHCKKGINNMAYPAFMPVQVGDLLVARATNRKIKGTSEKHPFKPCYVSCLGDNEDRDKIFEVTYIENPEIKQWIHPMQRTKLWNFL